MFEKIFPKIHNEGYKFIVIFVFATIVLYFIHGFLGFAEMIPEAKEVRNAACKRLVEALQ